MIRVRFDRLVSFVRLTSFRRRTPGEIERTGGKEDLKNVLLTVPVSSKIAGDSKDVTVTTSDGKSIAAQLAKPALLSEAGQGELTVLLPLVKAGENVNLIADFTRSPLAKDGFHWKDVDGLEELHFDQRPVLRYSTSRSTPRCTRKKEIANPTTKPYHHLFAPDGKTIVTNSNRVNIPPSRHLFSASTEFPTTTRRPTSGIARKASNGPRKSARRGSRPCSSAGIHCRSPGTARTAKPFANGSGN